MANWATKRRLIYFIFFGLFTILISVFIWRNFLYKAPTCFDKKQNQQEGGIDCGGPCNKLCIIELADPIVLWSRVVKVSDGNYHLLSYVENSNPDAEAYDTPYSFRIYDSKNILIYEKSGITFIPAKKIFPIFEASINSGERIPIKAFFNFKSDIKWVKTTEQEPILEVRDEVFSREDISPRLDAVIENKSVKTIKNIEVTATLFDIKNNVMGVSKTIIDSIGKNSSKQIVFTWPVPFTSEVVKIDIIPIISKKLIKD